MSTNVIQPSFAAGELSPSIFGRTDLGKYHSGVALAENMIVDFKGGLFNRTGTKIIGQTKIASKAARIIPFQFSTVQTYILELGDFYIRFIANGGYVLEAAKVITGISQANPGVVNSAAHGFSNGDTVYLQSIVGMVEINDRFALVAGATTDTFQLTDTNGVNIDTSNYSAYVSGGTVSRVYTLVSPYAAADLAKLNYTQTADVMTLVHPSYPPYDLSRIADTNWTIAQIVFGSSMTIPSAIAGTIDLSGGYSFVYEVTAVDKDGNESLPSPPGIATGGNFKTTAGQCGLRWTQTVNAEYYRVYRIPTAFDPAINVSVGDNYGWIGNAYGITMTDDNITPDMTISPPVHRNPFVNGGFDTVFVTGAGTGYPGSFQSVSVATSTGSGADIIAQIDSFTGVSSVIIRNSGQNYTSGDTLSVLAGAATMTFTLTPQIGNYPAAVGYFQQRKVFGGSTNHPETVWMSQPGAFKNFDIANPVKNDDAITITLASKQVNNIKYMIGMPGGLIVLTGSSAWQISSGQQNGAVTPSQVVATPQAYTGCADVEPIIINYDIIYVQSRGNVIRDLSYNFYVNIYTGIDISLLSNHLLVDYQILQWTYVEEPYKVVWAIRNDGALLSLTYLKEQEVYGWCHHYTQGLFQSVASVQEGTENVLYVIVKRFINGFWVQFVERMASRTLTYGVEDAWFLDCALQTIPSYPAATLTPSAASGAGVLFNASAAVFSASAVGKILRCGGGIATITGFNNASQLVGTFTQAMTDIVYNTTIPVPQVSGKWSLWSNVTTIYGLNHLEGQAVTILADGAVVNGKTVTNGQVTLNTPASKITVGLPYTSKMQTLPLDTGEPTIQGKRKKIAALTLKIEKTQGIEAGSTFATLCPIKETTDALVTDDPHFIMDPSWNVPGQICIQQENPLPCKILAVVPEIVVGDSPSK